MTAIIPTYPPDYVMAATAATALRMLGVRVVLAIDQADPLLQVEGCEIVRTTYARRTKLYGKGPIVGNLELMERFGTGPYTIKADSDALVLSLDFLAGRTETAVGIWSEPMHGMQGSCYALRTDALSAMIAKARELPDLPHLLDDKTTGDIAATVGPVHLPVHHREPTRWIGYRRDESPAWHRERADVVIFNRKRDFDRHAAAAAMKSFLQ